MDKKDEQLISQFMQANKLEIEDNGFSRKVMHRLPVSTAKIWSDILTVVCAIACCILFYVYDGDNLILHSLREVFQNQSMELMNQPNNLRILVIALATIGFLSIRSVWTIKE